MGPTISAEAISECILKKKKKELKTALGNVSVQRSLAHTEEARWKLAITKQTADNPANAIRIIENTNPTLLC